MEILKADYMGFCFGVKNAIQRANDLLSKVKNDDIYMLGEIIHNPQVIKGYKKKGIHVVDNIGEVPPRKYLITRAHGLLRDEVYLAKKREIRLIDTTCPYVRKLHKIAVLLQEEDYQIVVFGDMNHSEIQSLLSYVHTETIVVNSVDEIRNNQFADKVGLLSQTTKEINEYQAIVAEISKKVAELRVFNTICKATRRRQEATMNLAEKVDIMIVVGGSNSANTTRLYQISTKKGVKTYQVETEKQLRAEWFKTKRKIGITSGASTPDDVTEKIIKRIKMMNVD